MTLLYFILLVGVLIFVHELGHFLFAKLFDVKVLKFSLGFGPAAAGFQRGETEYRIAWLPLGGYVKMLGEDPTDEVRREDHGRAFHQKPLWQRYIIVFAGPAFNLIFPTFIYFVFFAAQTRWSPPVVGKVFPDQPAAEAGLQPGDTILAIDGQPIRYWKDPAAAGGGLWSVKYNISSRPGQSLRVTIERDEKVIHRFITPRENVHRNRLGFTERYGLIGISPFFELAQVGISQPDAPAAKAGLKTGDLVTSVDERPVERWADLERRLSRNRGQSMRVSYLRPSKSVSGFIDLHVLHPAATVVDPEPRYDKGKVSYDTGIASAEFFVHSVQEGSPAAQIGLRRGDRITAFDGKPVTHWALIQLKLQDQRDEQHTLNWVQFAGGERTATFRLAKEKYVDEYKHEQDRYVFGARNGTLWKSSDPIPVEGRLSYATIESVRKTGEIVAVMALAIVQVIRGEISRDTVGGPVMLAHTARVAAEKGWDHFIWMMALISINLGMLNLLPIPILDGGHIMFFTVEAVKRRPLSLRAREVASYVGLFLLVSLMIFALKNDIVRYWFK